MPLTKRTITQLVAAINLKLAKDDAPLLRLVDSNDSHPYQIKAGGDIGASQQRLTGWLKAHECHTWLCGFLAARLHDGLAKEEEDDEGGSLIDSINTNIAAIHEEFL